MHEGRTDPPPIVQRGPVDQGQDSRRVGPALKLLPAWAHLAHEIIHRGHGKGNENEKGKPARPDVEARQILQNPSGRLCVKKVEHRVQRGISKGRNTEVCDGSSSTIAAPATP